MTMNSLDTSDLRSLAAELRERRDEIQNFRVVGGFDGFIDQLIHIVDTREDAHAYTAVETMSAFAEKLHAASGKSSLSEIDIHCVDAGGCAVNLCDVYNTMGIAVDYFGTLGQPLHPAFAPFADACNRCHSWLDGHGTTLALEFNDGKYMLASMSALHRFTAEHMLTYLEDGVFLRSCQQAQLICMCNWTLYPHMTDCWKLLQSEVFAHTTHQPFLFFDLVNPSSRSTTEQLAMLHVLRDFSDHGKVILGVNLNEAQILAKTLGIQLPNHDDITALTVALRKRLDIFEVVTHGIHTNCVAGIDYVQDNVSGPYCKTPQKSTGAGDRFNAGYCLGHLLGATPTSCLQLGVASSGYFVRNAHSPCLDAMALFLEQWAQQNAF